MAMARKYQQRSGVAEQRVGDERMLLDEASNAVHVLNGSAAFIWDCLKTALTLDQIAQRLGEEYDLSATADVADTIRRVLGDLQKKGLVLTIPVD